MFVGHAAVALAARPLLPRRSLGVLFAAAFWVDLVWPVLLLLGVETVRVRPGDTAFTPLEFVDYPWTHSLLAVVGWSLLFALVVLRGAIRPKLDFCLLALLVASHWLLDFVTHRPDLPLVPGGTERWGLGLWNSVPATLAVEGALFALGIAIYIVAVQGGRERKLLPGGWPTRMYEGPTWAPGGRKIALTLCYRITQLNLGPT
jgi:membrane-bound metal-dependent hydrolase YbcI (DUF457 family)